MYAALPPPVLPPPLRRPGFPMPAYRYVPGLLPHPFKDPAGHGHVGPSDAVERWIHGQDLFDHRYYWEAHEIWEGLWKSLPRASPRWYLVRGMIQASASVLKRHMDHIGPSLRLWKNAQHSIGLAGGEAWDLDLPRVVHAVESYHGGGDWPLLAPAPSPAGHSPTPPS